MIADAEITAAVHPGNTRATMEGANRVAAPIADKGGGRGSGDKVERHEGDSRT